MLVVIQLIPNKMYKYIGIHRCTDTQVDRHRYTMTQTYKNKNKAKETQRCIPDIQTQKKIHRQRYRRTTKRWRRDTQMEREKLRERVSEADKERQRCRKMKEGMRAQHTIKDGGESSRPYK